MSSLFAVAGLLVALGAAVVMAKNWPTARGSPDSNPSAVAASVGLLAAAFVFYVVGFGALRGSLIALFVIGAVALLAALAVEIRGAKGRSTRRRGY